jgi:uncharacterized protein
MNFNKCQAGLGLRSVHYPYLEKNVPQEASWFEVVSENYMDSWGRPREFLNFIRKDFPVALHGVGLSLASAEGLRKSYLHSLKRLVDEIDPFLVSDHLCWTGTKKNNLHDLLPFPHNNESLEKIVDNIDQVQNYLQRQILVENVSTYLTFTESSIAEPEFITEVAKRSGSKILLDLNNVYVNATNHGFCAKEFIGKIPCELVGQIHLAGYSDLGDYLFDTHSQEVYPQVWELFSLFIKTNPNMPFMIEWDEDIPNFNSLESELKKAKNIWGSYHGRF